MDFASMMQPVHFGAKHELEEHGATVPIPLRRRQSATRRLAMLKEAQQILGTLPTPGEAVHVIQSGRYDLADVIEAILQAKGKVDHLRIATLSFNSRNVDAMKRWLETGNVSRLTLLCSSFFRDQNSELFTAAMDMLKKPHRLAAARNHCKVVCFAFQDGSRLALEGSANLRNNGNREQFAIFNDRELHDWHAAWIDAEVQANEGDQSSSKATG